MSVNEGKLVLLVDDERDVLTTTKLLLQSEGYDIKTACNGFEALDHVRSHSCDLLITDMRMPGMNGLQLVGEIRNLNIAVQAIIMTGYTDIDNPAMLEKKYGVAGLVQKPIRDLDEFLELIQATLSKREWTPCAKNH